jgi:hypothetical protein
VCLGKGVERGEGEGEVFAPREEAGSGEDTWVEDCHLISEPVQCQSRALWEGFHLLEKLFWGDALHFQIDGDSSFVRLCIVIPHSPIFSIVAAVVTIRKYDVDDQHHPYES